MIEIRRGIFGSDFPASAAITVAASADPNMMIEIQGIAVPEQQGCRPYAGAAY
jgi:enamine deaminase RidA (YjgF/YER057c/UK114 family)